MLDGQGKGREIVSATLDVYCWKDALLPLKRVPGTAPVQILGEPIRRLSGRVFALRMRQVHSLLHGPHDVLGSMRCLVEGNGHHQGGERYLFRAENLCGFLMWDAGSTESLAGR